ncbi:MAG: TrkA family potassium uptake protein [Gammaproteobacteria bacterium]|nr:TrkA family potassium uptake protein [Gammaproteobacteria bacterium]
MRIVFVGAGMLTIMTTRFLLQRGHEVVIVEKHKAVIESLAEELDCGFLHGDGTKPAVLRETDPKETNIFFCLTGNDQTNIIASLVGRTLGFERIVTKVEDEEFEHICIELGLADVIIPDLTIGRHLADIVEGQNIMELALMIKGDARVFSFVANIEDEKPLEELELPPKARVICIYRDGEFLLPEEDIATRRNDEVVILSHQASLPALTARWGPRNHNQ